MLAAQAKERRRIAGKMPATGTVAAAPLEDFGMSRFKGSGEIVQSFLPLEGVSLSSMDLRRFERVMSDRVPFEEPGPRCPRERRGGWRVAAVAWLGVRSCTAVCRESCQCEQKALRPA